MHRLLCLPILCAALVCVGCGSDEPQAPPRESIKQYLKLDLPENATNINFKEESLFVQWIYARFDIQADDLPTVLSSKLFKKIPALSSDPKKSKPIVKNFRTYANETPWCQPPTGVLLEVSKGSWWKMGKTSKWECTLRVCVYKMESNQVSVFIQYSEEPYRKDYKRP